MLKYIEIDSTYRDRQKFPNPTQFQLLIAQTGNRDSVYTSVDPVTYAAPRVTYCPQDINNLICPIIIDPNTGFAISSPLAVSTPPLSKTAIVKIPSSLKASKISNYYRGCYIKLYDVLGVRKFMSLIFTSEFLSTDGSTDYFKFVFEEDNTLEYLMVSRVDIGYPTEINEGIIFIPTGEYPYHMYDDWYIYNETKNEYSKIVYYDGFYSIASIFPIRINWQATDTLSLRKQLPVTIGTFQAGSTSTSLIISTATSDSRARYYNGMFVRFTSGVNKNKILGIYSYSGAPLYRIDVTGYVATPPTNTDTYEILPFTKDNYTPLSYTGSIVSQENCYDVQLIYLILPNLQLSTGGTIASQPYLYVELQNVSTAGGSVLNVSYSNNPHSTKKLFRVPITDIAFQSDDAFITLDKSNSLQTVRINPFGNFSFGVYLCDGSELKYSLNDTESPYSPNPYLQVSAVFALRRV